MSRKRLKRKSARTEGFAMPLTLAVLLILSYIIAVGLQRVEVSQAEARLASATTADVLDATLVEQDVVWRGVLELLAKPIAGVGSNNYGARAPNNPWIANARAYLWSPHTHRRPRTTGRGPASGRQSLCEPQPDRRHRRLSTLRR